MRNVMDTPEATRARTEAKSRLVQINALCVLHEIP